MKFLLDVNASGALLSLLIELGHDVICVRDDVTWSENYLSSPNPFSRSKTQIIFLFPSPAGYGVHTSPETSQVTANSPPSPQFWGDKKI